MHSRRVWFYEFMDNLNEKRGRNLMRHKTCINFECFKGHKTNCSISFILDPLLKELCMDIDKIVL